jgi:hypothetical protein
MICQHQRTNLACFDLDQDGQVSGRLPGAYERLRLRHGDCRRALRRRLQNGARYESFRFDLRARPRRSVRSELPASASRSARARTSLRASAVVLMSNSLDKVNDVFALAQRAWRIVRRICFGLSFTTRSASASP